MGRPKGSKNKVKRAGSTGRGPGRPAAARRGRPPMAKAKRGRRGRPAVSAARAGFSFNPIEWAPLISEIVKLVQMIREVIAKENGVATEAPTVATTGLAQTTRTSPSVAKTVVAAAKEKAAVSEAPKKRGRPKKEDAAPREQSAGKPAAIAAMPSEDEDTQEELFDESELDDGSDVFEDEELDESEELADDPTDVENVL
jgi:hypothetical protein